MSDKKVLIVDDDPDVKALLVQILGVAGFSTDVATDGEEALRKATTEPYDLILMDLQMPGWDGWEAIGSLEVVFPDTRILVVSGLMDEETEERLGKYPSVVGAIRKPFQPNEVIDRIKSLLGAGLE